jgi:hypothetical protein
MDNAIEKMEMRMTALGLNNVELISRYCGVPATSMRRALSGAPANGTLEKLGKVLSELEDLKTACWPIPIDWSQFVFVRMTQERIGNRSLKIEIVKVPVSIEAGIAALGGESK